MTSLRRQTTLSNGLTIVTETVDTVRSVALGIWVRAGSRYEPPELAGISHFLEHTVFKGTTSRSTYDIASGMESLGGQLNAFTSKEYTCYHARFLSDYLEEAVDVLTDILLHPTFPDAEIQREKSVVLDELRDSLDVPEEIAFENFEESLYPNISLGRPVLGNETSIKSFNAEKLTTYLDLNYGPKNSIIVAAGYVDHDELVNLISERYDRQSNNENRFEAYDVSSYKPGLDIKTKDIQQSHLILGLPIFSVFDERRYDIAVLNSILSGGMSSRLFQNIREAHGVAYQIFSFVNLYRDTGSFGVYLATDPAKREQALDLTVEELSKMAREHVNLDCSTDQRRIIGYGYGNSYTCISRIPIPSHHRRTNCHSGPNRESIRNHTINNKITGSAEIRSYSEINIIPCSIFYAPSREGQGAIYA